MAHIKYIWYKICDLAQNKYKHKLIQSCSVLGEYWHKINVYNTWNKWMSNCYKIRFCELKNFADINAKWLYILAQMTVYIGATLHYILVQIDINWCSVITHTGAQWLYILVYSDYTYWCKVILHIGA